MCATYFFLHILLVYSRSDSQSLCLSLASLCYRCFSISFSMSELVPLSFSFSLWFGCVRAYRLLLIFLSFSLTMFRSIFSSSLVQVYARNQYLLSVVVTVYSTPLSVYPPASSRVESFSHTSREREIFHIIPFFVVLLLYGADASIYAHNSLVCTLQSIFNDLISFCFYIHLILWYMCDLEPTIFARSLSLSSHTDTQTHTRTHQTTHRIMMKHAPYEFLPKK